MVKVPKQWEKHGEPFETKKESIKREVESPYLTSSSSQPDTHSDWNADTGATSHMTPNRQWFHHYTPYCAPIRLADNTIVFSAGVGSVWFKPVIRGKEASAVEFTRVLHVSKLATNLLSVLFLTRRCGYTV